MQTGAKMESYPTRYLGYLRPVTFPLLVPYLAVMSGTGIKAQLAFLATPLWARLGGCWCGWWHSHLHADALPTSHIVRVQLV